MDFLGENSGDSVELQNVPLGTIPTGFSATDPSAILNGTLPSTSSNAYNDTKHPFVAIVEQPQQRGFRFRYECEGPSHGGLRGVTTDGSHKTCPAIRVVNYKGPACVEVSLVTDETPPRIHAHRLVGKNCDNGVCSMTLTSTASVIGFPNLCIQHVTRKKAAEVLLPQILEDMKLKKQLRRGDLSPQPLTTEDNLMARKQAQDQARSMALNAVRLQFRVLLPDAEGQYVMILPPVVSEPIYDSKSPGASALKICRMDRYGGCCTGNEEVFLLCEKVQKEDIAVRFVELGPDGSVKWEAYGNFSPLDVHRQYAIVFKTPPYINTNIDRAVRVRIMLQRKSDKDVSEAKDFTYYPQNRDKDLIAGKKRKQLPLDSTLGLFGRDGGPGGGAGGLGGGHLGLGPRFGSLGSCSFAGGGGGRGGGQSGCSYSVVLPDGNIVDQTNILPTVVDQAVKEEFSQIPEPARVDQFYQDLLENSPENSLENPLESFLFNDVETDAAPSLRHPSQMVPSWKSQPERAVKVSLKTLSLKTESGHDKQMTDSNRDKQKKVSDEDEQKKDSGEDAQKKDSGEDEQKGSKDNEQRKDSDKDRVTGSESDSVTHDVDKGSSAAGELRRKDSTSCQCQGHVTDPAHSGQVKAGDKPPSDSGHQRGSDQDTVTLTGDKGGPVGGIGGQQHSMAHIAICHTAAPDGGGHSGTVLLASRPSEVISLSEGARTDEGFSEGSDRSSVKGQEPRSAHASLKGSQTEGAEGEEVATKPERVVTAVVQRIVQRITAKTVLALRDYSETGDLRYLLLVQRHLTAIRNENGDLPLHLAVINNQSTALRHLLAIMMSLPNARHVINTYNYIRQTALHLAAIMQQPMHIEWLLHAGAEPSLADRNGNTPAHLAVLNNSVQGLQSLLKYLRPGVTATNPFPELHYLNYDGYSPVHLAAHRGNVEMLRLLVHGLADVDLGDGKSGRTALHHAVEMDDLPVAGFLLMEANADVNARSFDGNTPLHVACCRGLIGMVALLMTAGALTDVENEEIPSEDSGEEGKERGERCCHHGRGLQPRDYAAGKDRLRILRMLTGDFAMENPDPAVNPDLVSDLDLTADPDLAVDRDFTVDPKGEESSAPPVDHDLDPSDVGSHRPTHTTGVVGGLTTESGGRSVAAKEKLSEQDHEALSTLLDPECPGKDVLELAERLGYHALVPALEVMASSGSSPTLYLLDYHETYGSLSRLRECLQAMQRDDAVQVLDADI